MIGKKNLNDIRESVRSASGQAVTDLTKALDNRSQRSEQRQPLKPVEIETLNLIRDGLRKRRNPTKAAGKRVRTR